jgi:iodotyrosine deiodinase
MAAPDHLPDDFRWAPLQYARPEAREALDASRAFLGLLSKRRSVRQFSSEPVPHDLVRNAVATAATAPWGASVQPWTFVVVSDNVIRRRVRQSLGEEVVDAPYAIAVFARSSAVEGAGRHRAPEAAPSVGLATGLLVASLHVAGLATLVITPRSAELGLILDRPESELPHIVVLVGYPAPEAIVPQQDRLPLAEAMVTFPPESCR